MSENSPSKVAAADQPFSHFSSAEAVVSAVFDACAAPLTRKVAPGIVWNSAVMLRSVLKLCAQAARPRSVISLALSGAKASMGFHRIFTVGAESRVRARQTTFCRRTVVPAQRLWGRYSQSAQGFS